MIALQGCEKLTLQPPVKVGAGLRSRHIELGRDRKGMAHEPEFVWNSAQVSARLRCRQVSSFTNPKFPVFQQLGPRVAPGALAEHAGDQAGDQYSFGFG